MMRPFCRALCICRRLKAALRLPQAISNARKEANSRQARDDPQLGVVRSEPFSGEGLLVRRIPCCPQLVGLVMNHGAFAGTKGLGFARVNVDGNIKGSLPQGGGGWGQEGRTLFLNITILF